MGYEVDVNQTILERINGSWEALIELELADVLVDVVKTGNTSRANKLKSLAKVLDSNAILIERVK